KNAIDWTSRGENGEAPLAAYRGKKALILSTSPGSRGGQRGLKQLRELLEGIGVTVLPTEVVIPRAHEAFDTIGNLTRPGDRTAVEELAEQLASKPAA